MLSTGKYCTEFANYLQICKWIHRLQFCLSILTSVSSAKRVRITSAVKSLNADLLQNVEKSGRTRILIVIRENCGPFEHLYHATKFWEIDRHHGNGRCWQQLTGFLFLVVEMRQVSLNIPYNSKKVFNSEEKFGVC